MLGNKKKYEIPEIPGVLTVKPVAAPERLSFEGTSFWPVKEALLEVFGAFPFELTTDNLPLLKAMAAASGEGKRPYEQLAESIVRHGGVLINHEKAS